VWDYVETNGRQNKSETEGWGTEMSRDSRNKQPGNVVVGLEQVGRDLLSAVAQTKFKKESNQRMAGQLRKGPIQVSLGPSHHRFDLARIYHTCRGNSRNAYSNVLVCDVLSWLLEMRIVMRKAKCNKS